MPSKYHRRPGLNSGIGLPKDPAELPPEGFEERRRWEIEKYRKIYGEYPQYHMSGRRMTRFVDWAKTRGVESLLDIGCGRGELLDAARRSPVFIPKVRGYEVVPDLCERGEPNNGPGPEVQHFDGMHSIPEEDNSWDWVTCCDVLEHVQEEDGIAGLREMARVAKTGLYITVSWAADAWGRVLGPNGVLHINRKPREWWTIELEKLKPKYGIVVLRWGPNDMDVEVML